MRSLSVGALVIGMSLALVACGGGGSASGSGTTTLTGLAATGAGIANGTVTARCASGPVLTGSTDGSGVFTLSLGTDRTLPCMLQVSGGTPNVTLFSFAQASGRVNITPATDLVVTRALGADPSAQFAAFNATAGNTIASNLAAAKTYVNNQLSAITGSTFSTDLMTGVFAVGDADDKVLDTLAAAMQNADESPSSLRAAAANNSNLTESVNPYLAPPSDVVATANSASQITVSWTGVPGATSYKVYRATATGNVDTAGDAIGTTTTTTYVDAGLSASTAYFYKTVAVNAVVAGSQASAEANSTTLASSGGGTGGNNGGGTGGNTGGSSGLTCNTALFQQGAPVRSPTTTELASFARTYSGSEGSFNDAFEFAASGSATLVFNANGNATYNSTALTISSYCLETLSGNAGTQLVIHTSDNGHFDLKTSGAWTGFTGAGKVVKDIPYGNDTPNGSSSGFGSLSLSGNAVGIQGAAVPTGYTPTAQGTHPTATVSWSMPSGNSNWFITLSGNVVTSTAGFGSWQKQVAQAGIESIGVSFDLPNGRITFSDVSLPAFANGQTGTMVLNGTLIVPAASGTAVTLTGTGIPAAGSGFDAPAASVSTFLVGSVTKNIYTWNGGKGISVQVENYSNGSKTLTVTNAAGPSWRNLSPGNSVQVDTSAKTVTVNNASATGISPTSTTITLNGTLTLP